MIRNVIKTYRVHLYNLSVGGKMKTFVLSSSSGDDELRHEVQLLTVQAESIEKVASLLNLKKRNRKFTKYISWGQKTGNCVVYDLIVPIETCKYFYSKDDLKKALEGKTCFQSYFDQEEQSEGCIAHVSATLFKSNGFYCLYRMGDIYFVQQLEKPDKMKKLGIASFFITEVHAVTSKTRIKVFGAHVIPDQNQVLIDELNKILKTPNLYFTIKGTGDIFDAGIPGGSGWYEPLPNAVALFTQVKEVCGVTLSNSTAVGREKEYIHEAIFALQASR